MQKYLILLFLFFLSFRLDAKEEFLHRFGDTSWPNKVLFSPGLNFNTQAFFELRDELLNKEIEVWILQLKFTSEPDRLWEDGDLAKIWLQQFGEAYERLALETQGLGGNFKVLSYSLGGLVTETYLQRNPKTPKNFQSLFYLAPALSAKWYLEFFMNLSKVLEESIRIPSWNLEAYQTRSYTYAGEYEALLQLLEAEERQNWGPLDVETYLFMSPNDELLNFEKVKNTLSLLRKKANVKQIKKTKNNTIGKHHLIVDSQSLDDGDYTKLLELLRTF